MNHFIHMRSLTAAVLKRNRSLFAPDLEQYHDELAQRIRGRNILVIGGAGTIGSSFLRALLRIAEPRQCIVADTNENALTELVRDLRSSTGYFLPKSLITYPVNFNDPVFYKILQKEGPFDIVANFAAHKHVRSEKDLFSIEAMVNNNVLYAGKLLKTLSDMGGLEHFFAVSTDKAANPVSVMGASKKIMEDLLMAYSGTLPITTARFANVAFSNGSLLQGFIERLMKRQPLSSPNDIRRYFVSPDESGEICMMSCLLGNSGEIFFPKLDPEKDLISFSDIAVEFLKQFNYRPRFAATEQEAREWADSLDPDSDEYPVYFFSSDTSGEKSYEEFFTADETLDLRRFNQLGVILNTPRKPLQVLDSLLLQLRRVFEDPQAGKADLVAALSQYLPTFHHIETGKGLDQKM